MFRKKLFLLSMVVFVLSFSLVVSVEASSTIWSQTYGGTWSDFAHSVITTSDGGYALAGVVYSIGDGLEVDVRLVKTDSAGNMEWKQTYEETGRTEAYSLVETLDGGYALTGWTDSFGAGSDDFWLAKTDAFGNMEWNKTYGGTSDDMAYALVETSDGGYLMAGSTRSFGSPFESDSWLVKTDEYGNEQWSRTYGGTGGQSASSLVVTSDGGYAIACNNDDDIWLFKTNSYGDMLWNKTHARVYPGPSPFLMHPFSLVETSDSGYAIATATGPFGGTDVYLVKTDASGDMEWNQTYGGPDLDWAASLVEMSDGGYAIAGSTNSSGAGEFDFWLIKTDSSGSMDWKQTYGGTGFDFVHSMVTTSDGKYILAGRTNSFGAGREDFWLVKTAGCVDTYEFETYEFDFSYGYGEYVVLISTNSTVGGFDFGIGQDRISFTVTGPTGTTGVAKILIPEDLTDGEFPVYLNELMLLEDAEYTKTYNGTHTIIEMSYSHSTHIIEITGTNVIPEYSSWLLPSLLLIATLFIVINKKKLLNQRS